MAPSPNQSFQQMANDQPEPADSGYLSYQDNDSSMNFPRAALGSVLSDASDHIFENGRRYHGWRQGRYPHPNDEKEQDREDIKHHMTLLQTQQRLFLAPIQETPQRVLDLGTGTGIWAIECAQKYPSAEVIGVDLSPIQPLMVPSNLQFEVDDIEAPWTWGYNIFDYIHVRYMLAGTRDWPLLLTECMNALKPGGYVELIEMDLDPTCDDNSFPERYHVKEFIEIISKAGATGKGFHLDIAPKFKGLLEEAGFANIVEEKLNLPLGTWPQDPYQSKIGAYNREQLIHGLPSIGIHYLTKVEGWSREEVDDFFAKIRAQVMDDRIHCYWKTYFVYGQKPNL